jgi:hypothetical protein
MYKDDVMSEESKKKEDDAVKIQADAAIRAAKYQAMAQMLAAIVGAMALILVTIIGLKNNPSNPDIKSSPTPTFTPTATFTSTPTFTPTLTITPTPYTCPYQGQTDNETISNLIQAEAVASNTKDLSTILAIFDPNAIFYDYAPTPAKQWNGPIARYKEDLFKTTELLGVEHFDISPVGPGIDSNIAYYVSGSKGNYRVAGGSWTDFFNGSLISTPSTPFGSEHWILKKDNNGCWVINQMEFNAGHFNFPELP